MAANVPERPAILPPRHEQVGRGIQPQAQGIKPVDDS